MPIESFTHNPQIVDNIPKKYDEYKILIRCKNALDFAIVLYRNLGWCSEKDIFQPSFIPDEVKNRLKMLDLKFCKSPIGKIENFPNLE